jgi:cell division septation protein DedD
VTLPTQPTPSASQAAAAPQGQSIGLYSNPQEAVKVLKDDYSYWTGKLTESSFVVSLAVIGANWAVFGSVNKILENSWAKWSMAAVILSLVLSLIASWLLGELVRGRIEYAEENPARWQKEFNASIGNSSPWPLTPRIHWLAWIFRMAKIFLPIAGGTLFLVALFAQPKTQNNQSHSVSSALATPSALSSPSEVTAQPFTPAQTPTATPAGTPTATPTPTSAPAASLDSGASPTPSR